MPTKRIFNQKYLLPLRQKLRQDPSPSEIILWQKLKQRQILNRKFRRQHGVGKYIVDFYCAQENLVIELDGDSHFESGAIRRDAERASFLNSVGIRVLRFTNLEVKESLEGVLMEIEKEIAGKTSPTPPWQEGL